MNLRDLKLDQRKILQGCALGHVYVSDSGRIVHNSMREHAVNSGRFRQFCGTVVGQLRELGLVELGDDGKYRPTETGTALLEAT